MDSDFGDGGIARTDLGLFDTASGLDVQPDGKILAAGTVDALGTRRVFVARYLPDGRLDSGFGGNGLVVPDRFHQVAPRLALQSDGKIVLATRGETAGGPLFLYRFEADGQPDTGFGTGGTASITPPAGLGIVNVSGVDVLPDGRLVVGLRAGFAGAGESVAIARLEANGIPDVSFGSGGFVHVERARMWLPLAFELQPDGRMLVAGFAWLPDRFLLDAFVARFRADGLLDESFDGDGVAIVQRPSAATEFQALAVAPDGSIIAGGREFGSVFNQNRWVLARFASDGSLDATFGSAGVSVFDPASGDDVVLDVAVTSEGIYATGATESFSAGLPLALLQEDGTLDPQFGTGGITGLAGQFTRGAVRLTLDSSDKVLVIGSVQSFVPTFNEDIVLTRYEGAVADSVPPMLAVPSVVTVDATGPEGATVDYSHLVSATDDVDGPVPVSCDPAPGSTFPIGDTGVTCTAGDEAGNTAAASFSVHVKGTEEQLDDLVASAEAIGPGESLAALARAAEAAPGREATCQTLRAFANEVRAQAGKSLEPADAESLAAAADRIRAVLACPANEQAKE